MAWKAASTWRMPNDVWVAPCVGAHASVVPAKMSLICLWTPWSRSVGRRIDGCGGGATMLDVRTTIWTMSWSEALYFSALDPGTL